MVAGHGVLLLIAGLVLLVDNHQTQLLERQEDSTTGPEDNIIGMARKLFLPDLDAFGIGILGMIDAQAVAKHALQPFHHLDGEGNLRQEIEHLLFLFERLTDEMDIDLGLATGGHAMQQGNILFQKRELYLVIGILLNLAKRLDPVQIRFAPMIQTTHLLFVGLQKPSFDKGCERCETMPLIEQFVTGNLNDILQLIPMGKGQVVDESLQLFACPL